MLAPAFNARAVLAGCLAAALASLFALAVYRAATQPITVDAAKILTRPYGSANHVLQTLLMHASAGVLGPSELALRLPSLAGAALVLWALWRIAAGFRYMLFGALAVLLVAANPMILDHSAWPARLRPGYGLALGSSLWVKTKPNFFFKINGK